MKAKNILRISVFAALLCIMTMLSAFAAETDAKIFRFDGMGNVLLDNPSNGAVTSDGTFKITSKDSGATSNFNINGAYSFKLSEYPYIKIKYRTDYSGSIQFYVTPVNSSNTSSEPKPSEQFYIYSDLLQTSNWKTMEFSLVEGDCTFKNENWRHIYTYNGAALSLTDGISSEYFLPTAEKDITIDDEHSPFFQLKGQNGNGFFFEIEYIGFFSTEAGMKAYTGPEEADSHAKILAWDGSQNVTSTLVANNGNKLGNDTISVVDGNYKVVMDNSAHNLDTLEGSNLRYNFSISSDGFNLYDYPYVKFKYKTDFAASNSQWYIKVKEGGFICCSFATADDSDWKEIECYYPDATKMGDYSEIENNVSGTDANTGIKYHKYSWEEGTTYSYTYNGTTVETTATSTTAFPHFPTSTAKIPINSTYNPFFMLRFNGNDKVAANTKDKLNFELAYVAFFDSEEAMLAYGTSDENTKISAIDNAITTLLNDKTAYSFTKHPASTDKDILDYVENTVDEKLAASEAKSLYTASIDKANSTATMCKVLLTFESATYTKTIGINVKITELADITPTVKGAQIRTDGGDGLRFGFVYSADTTGYTEVQYGALLAGKDALGENEITIEKVATLKNDSDQPIIANVIATKKFDETAHIYTAVVTNIPDGQDDTKVVAVPYVTYKVAGKAYTVYGDKIIRSISDVKANIENWSTDNP